MTGLTPRAWPLWLLLRRKPQLLVPRCQLAGRRLKRQRGQAGGAGRRRAWAARVRHRLQPLLLLGRPVGGGVRGCREWRGGQRCLVCHRGRAVCSERVRLPRRLAGGPPAAQRQADCPRKAALLRAAVCPRALHHNASGSGVAQAAGHRLPAVGEGTLGALEAARPLLLPVEAHHPEDADAADADEGQDTVGDLRRGVCMWM